MIPRSRAQRDAILARRAAFIASALGATLVSVTPKVAFAEPAASCPDWRTRSSEDQTAAGALLEQAIKKREAGEILEAYDLLQKAQARAATPPILLELATMAAALGRSVEALDTVDGVLRCESDLTDKQRFEAEGLRREQLGRVGQLSIASDATGVEIYVDEVKVGSAPLSGPIRVLPGHHTITAREAAADGREVARSTVSVKGGDVAEVVLHASAPSPAPDTPVEEPTQPPPGPPPQVCLSPIPPGQEIDRRGLSPGLAAAPIGLFSTLGGDSHHYGGLGLAVVLNYGFSDNLAWRGSIFGAPSGSARGMLSPVAIHNAIRLQTHWVGASLGLSTGYLFVPQPSRSAPDAFEPLSGFFVQPEVSASLMALGRFEVEPRVGLLLSRQDDVDSTRFGASFVTAGIWVSYLWYEESSW